MQRAESIARQQMAPYHKLVLEAVRQQLDELMAFRVLTHVEAALPPIERVDAVYRRCLSRARAGAHNVSAL